MKDQELDHMLRQSIRYQERIRSLEHDKASLKQENALLRERIDVLSLRRLRDARRSLLNDDDVPALCRPQAG